MTDDTADRRDDRPVVLPTDDGERLEAAWSGPDDPAAVVVLTHPHPRYGGDMHNIVPASLARTLPDHDFATLRFNFRGAGRSTGSHGGGTEEVTDIRAAVDAATASFPGVPVAAVGYSFGADVLLAVRDPRLVGVVAVAPPLAVFDAGELRARRGEAPTLVLLAQHDQVRDATDAGAIVADWPDTRVDVLAGADHFMAGMADRISDLVVGFLRPILAR